MLEVEATSELQYPAVHLQVRLSLPDKPTREFSYDFRQGVISLGRDPTNDIQIPLTSVSRRHARLFYEHGDYFLEDLGSTHGTKHNGRRLQAGERRLLRDDDQIDVLSFCITFKLGEGGLLDRRPGEKTESLARRMVQEVLSSLDGSRVDLPALRVMNGPAEGLRHELEDQRAEVVIGRSPECDFAIDDQNISRRHCLIKRSWHGFTAQDLGSKNGVLVNDERIEGARMLKDGDELQLGGVKLIFVDPPSRLLAQIGGLPAETSDVQDGDGGQPDEAHAEGAEWEEGGEDGQDPHPDGLSSASHDIEPPLLAQDPPEALVEENEEMRAARQEFERIQKRGVFVDVLVLAVGLLILIGALIFVIAYFI